MEAIKKLKDQFKKNGLHYKLLKRSETHALVAVFGVPSKPISYEVHKVRVRPLRVLNGTILPPCERYASNEEFGKYAWSYQYLDLVYKDFPGMRS